jgi:3'(2'), 5'-bisphosphate nucleotidase
MTRSEELVTVEPPRAGDLALPLIAVAQRAGAAIMDVYRSDPNVRYKADRSPVTDADHAAEDIILEALAKLAPQIPAVAEESLAAGRIPDVEDCFFLVDPLDGTKEFIKKNGEFTVNIALIGGGRPTFGLVYAPDKRECYVTLGPDRIARCALSPEHNPPPGQTFDFEPLGGDKRGERPFTAIVSRSHLTAETEAFLARLGGPPRLLMGSSLKFGVLASGLADVYPRFAPTSEWDTAAGHALLAAAGGCLLTGDGAPFLYGKKDARFINPSFVAWRNADEAAARGHGAGRG